MEKQCRKSRGQPVLVSRCKWKHLYCRSLNFRASWCWYCNFDIESSSIALWYDRRKRCLRSLRMVEKISQDPQSWATTSNGLYFSRCILKIHVIILKCPTGFLNVCHVFRTIKTLFWEVSYALEFSGIKWCLGKDVMLMTRSKHQYFQKPSEPNKTVSSKLPRVFQFFTTWSTPCHLMPRGFERPKPCFRKRFGRWNICTIIMWVLKRSLSGFAHLFNQILEKCPCNNICANEEISEFLKSLPPKNTKYSPNSSRKVFGLWFRPIRPLLSRSVFGLSGVRGVENGCPSPASLDCKSARGFGSRSENQKTILHKQRHEIAHVALPQYHKSLWPSG